MKDFIRTASPLLAVIAIMTAYALGGEIATAITAVTVFAVYEIRRA